MDEDLFLFSEEGFDPEVLLVFDLGAMEWIISVPAGGGRKPPMAGEPHRVLRQRTEEEEEQLRLLKLLNDANSAKSLKRWKEAENESARQKHNKLLFARLEREKNDKKARWVPDVKKANKEIAERRQKEIRETRLANLEKARKSGR